MVKSVVNDDTLEWLLDLRPYITGVYGAFMTKSLDELLDFIWETVLHRENDVVRSLSVRLQAVVPEQLRKYSTFDSTQQLCKNSSDLLLLAGLLPVLVVLVLSILFVVVRKTCCSALTFASAGVVGALLSAACMALTLASLPNGTVQNEAELLSKDAVTTADELMERYLRDNITFAMNFSKL